MIIVKVKLLRRTKDKIMRCLRRKSLETDSVWQFNIWIILNSPLSTLHARTVGARSQQKRAIPESPLQNFVISDTNLTS